MFQCCFLAEVQSPQPEHSLNHIDGMLIRYHSDLEHDVNGRDRIPRAQPDKFHDWDWNYKQLLILPTPAPQSRRFAVVAGRPRPCD
jgi:hypothetical protein